MYRFYNRLIEELEEWKEEGVAGVSFSEFLLCKILEIIENDK